MKKTSSPRRLLTSAEYDSAKDFASFAALLESGIHPDAKTRARKGSLPRAPLWALGACLGASCVGLLFERGCLFEPIADEQGSLHGLLSLCLRSNLGMADFALTAVEQGKLAPDRAVADPAVCWNGFGEIVAKICISRKISQTLSAIGNPAGAQALQDEFGHEHFGPLEAFADSARGIHRRLLALAGEPSLEELRALSSAHIHLALALHLEQRSDLSEAAQAVCDARLPHGAEPRGNLVGHEEKALARMAGSLLRPFAPSADLAQDAAHADAVGAVFAIAAGAGPAGASRPPLIALAEAAYEKASRDPLGVLGAMSPFLGIPLSGIRPSGSGSEAFAEPECADALLAAGCHCGEACPDGTTLESVLERIEGFDPLRTRSMRGFAKLFASFSLGQSPADLDAEPALAQLSKLLRRQMEREALLGSTPNPAAIDAPRRAATL